MFNKYSLFMRGFATLLTLRLLLYLLTTFCNVAQRWPIYPMPSNSALTVYDVGSPRVPPGRTAPIHVIMRAGRWKQVNTVMEYIEASERFNENAAVSVLQKIQEKNT
jgi:hypothetical protein